MMFILRGTGAQPEAPGVEVKLSRKPPANLPDAKGKTDFFCVGEAEAMAALVGSLPVPRRLRDVGVPESVLGSVAAEAVGSATVQANPKPVTVADLVGLLRSAW